MTKRKKTLLKNDYLKKLHKWFNGRCCYCGGYTVICRVSKTFRPNRATIEHIIPQSDGGPNKHWNFALACAMCNGQRKDMSLTEWNLIKIIRPNKNRLNWVWEEVLNA